MNNKETFEYQNQSTNLTKTEEEKKLLQKFGEQLSVLQKDVLGEMQKAIECPEDMYTYLKTLLDIAKCTIREQSKVNPKYTNIKPKVFSDVEKIDVSTLTKAIMRNYVAQIADYIGYDYKILAQGGKIVDEFGRTSHKGIAGIIDMNPKEDYDYTYKKLHQPEETETKTLTILKTIEDYSWIEEQEVMNKVEKITTSEKDIKDAINKLAGLGNTLTRSDNFDKSTVPVFVFFEEFHNNGNIKRENFDSICVIIQYLRFLGTEGSTKEMDMKKSIHNAIEYLEWWNISDHESEELNDSLVDLRTQEAITYAQKYSKNTIFKEILDKVLITNAFTFSSDAIEILMQEAFDVIGIDMDHQAKAMNFAKDLPEDIDDLSTNIKKWNPNEGRGDAVIVDYRNNVFCKNLVENFLSSKSIQPMFGCVGGAGHAKGVCAIMEKMGFRTISVTPPSITPVLRKKY